MRVAVVAECFLPEINGVTNSVLRVLEQLRRGGHDTLVIAPGDGPTTAGLTPVARVPAVALPFYRSVRVGLPTPAVGDALARFGPDVVHLAAPFVLGAAGARAARRLGVPSVAVYQTDVAGFARRYHLGALHTPVWAWLRRIHGWADLTLAPSTVTAWELRAHGIGPVEVWGRGVDTARFHPAHRREDLRRDLAPAGEVLVGYVGRLAREKQVHLLAHLAGLPGARLVVVGDGPKRRALEHALPGAHFLGFCQGRELSQAVAALDVFVHTGIDETFCQAVQEALASGVPVVAPASGGPLDLVRHGDNGWLYPPAKPELLRGAVEALVGAPALRARMAQRALRSVDGRSWEALVDQLVGHYGRVAGRGLATSQAA